MHEWLLSREVEMQYVRTYWKVADIFTKALKLDKLRHFSEILGWQHLDVPHLRERTDGRMGKNNNSSDGEFEPVGEVESETANSHDSDKPD